MRNIRLLLVVVFFVCACTTVQTGYYVFNRPIVDPLFEDLMSDITDLPMTDGNRVSVLENGVEIFPSMMDAIVSAETFIHLETYIFYGDSTGMRFAEVLARKAREGVEVRVIYDHVGARDEDRFHPLMEEAGVQVEMFNPFRWYAMLKGNYRTHRKILVVDGKVGFTGGVGFSEEWEGDADSPHHWRDTHVRVEGPVVEHLERQFAENWFRQTGEDLAGDPKYEPEVPLAGDALCGVAGAVESKVKWARIREMFLLPLAAARDYYYLNIAYFIPDQDTMQALAEAVHRGVDVRFIVPGRENDLVAVRWVSRKYYGKLLDMGVRIYEYQNTNMHSKTAVCDDLWATIGSSNFDNRTFNFNYESNLVVLDRQVAQEMKQMFMQDLQNCKQIDRDQWAKRPIHHKFMENIVGLIEGWM